MGAPSTPKPFPELKDIATAMALMAQCDPVCHPQLRADLRSLSLVLQQPEPSRDNVADAMDACVIAAVERDPERRNQSTWCLLACMRLSAQYLSERPDHSAPASFSPMAHAGHAAGMAAAQLAHGQAVETEDPQQFLLGFYVAMASAGSATARAADPSWGDSMSVVAPGTSAH